jgi:RNA polymerase sigma factor (sigma-70 family)
MATSRVSEVVQHLRRTAALREGSGSADGRLLEDYVCHRDQAALATLVCRHGPMVWGVCRRVLRNHQDAEDAFQAAFLVLVRKAASVVPPERVGNWLYGVAHQTALKARATAARRRGRERQMMRVPEAAVAEQDLWQDLDPLLDEELSRLPDTSRTVIVLCDLEGKTRKEVARRLGWPEGTVAGRLARARALLAERLARRGVTLSGGALALMLAQNGAAAGVPSALALATIEAATLSAAGRAAAGVASTKVAALTGGVLKAMLLAKLGPAAATVTLLGVGAGIALWTAAQEVVGTAQRDRTVPSIGAPAAVATASGAADALANRPVPPVNPGPEEDGRTALPEPARAGAPGDSAPALPPGWSLAGVGAGNYEVTRDGAVRRGGAASGRIRSKAAPEAARLADLKSAARLTQTFRAADYRGGRVRLSGYVRTEGLRGGARLWMRVDGAEALFGDDPGDDPVTRTSDWVRREVVLDVPPAAAYVHIGVVVEGAGTAWFDDLRVEAVGPDVAPTNPSPPGRYERPQPKPAVGPGPVNLGFEDLPAK